MSSASSRGAEDRRPDVLIVDDDPGVREAMADLLDDAGYRTVTAADGEQALKLLARTPSPCLIVLDLVMPGMNGWDLWSSLRDDPELADIPVLVVTAAPETIPGVRVLRKPIDVDRLLGAIAEHCGRR